MGTNIQLLGYLKNKGGDLNGREKESQKENG